MLPCDWVHLIMHLVQHLWAGAAAEGCPGGCALRFVLLVCCYLITVADTVYQRRQATRPKPCCAVSARSWQVYQCCCSRTALSTPVNSTQDSQKMKYMKRRQNGAFRGYCRRAAGRRRDAAASGVAETSERPRLRGLLKTFLRLPYLLLCKIAFRESLKGVLSASATLGPCATVAGALSGHDLEQCVQHGACRHRRQ